MTKKKSEAPKNEIPEIGYNSPFHFPNLHTCKDAQQEVQEALVGLIALYQAHSG